MFWTQGNLYQKAIKAFFLWLSTIAIDKDAILVDTIGRKEFFYFDFPLRYGDKPKKTKTLSAGREITFIIRKPHGKRFIREGEWIKIFSSPELEILENKKRISGTPPLRWGLTDEEKKTALKISRDALEKFLKSNERFPREYFYGLPQRFFLKTDLDVALWVGGCLRGSAVVKNLNLGNGITEAALFASHDARFKPLIANELSNTRIEITLMREPRIPLSIEERKKNMIYPEKGYLLECGLSRGWYLPEVFNVRRFRNLDEFLGDLVQEKAKLDRSALQDADVFIFEVDDFIESNNREKVLSLSGPVVISPESQVSNFEELFLDRLKMAADWLCRIQETDGNMPPIIDPLTGRIVRQIDWPRLAFVAWALAAFYKIVRKDKYIQAAEKSFKYLKRFLIPNSQSIISGYELTLAYFGQLSFCLEKPNDAATAADIIIGRLHALKLEPITLAQIASFFKVVSRNDPRLHVSLEELLRIVKEEFEIALRSRLPMNLAVWAELVNTFFDIDSEFSQKVADWLKCQQLPDGLFPESAVSDFTYTRGTGKVFEALALDPEKNKDALVRTLPLLLSMQYDEENTFFIPEEIRPKILGGFRHDFFNSEAWIDAAGHVLLGGIRLITEKSLWK